MSIIHKNKVLMLKSCIRKNSKILAKLLSVFPYECPSYKNPVCVGMVHKYQMPLKFCSLYLYTITNIKSFPIDNQLALWSRDRVNG